LLFIAFAGIFNCGDDSVASCKRSCTNQRNICFLALSDQNLTGGEAVVCSLITETCSSSCYSRSSSSGTRTTSSSSSRSSGSSSSGSGSSGSGSGGHGGGGH
ncbi:MAG TPA: hypothetical protein PK683_11220, partial [Leptospiraceae bacterium]|nr:hypothetical protein [Leptospiraceae bacterium]